MWYVAGLLSMGGHGTPGTPDFGRLVNPISTRGANYTPTSLLAPPDFQTSLPV